MAEQPSLPPADVGAVIDLALSDHIGFEATEADCAPNGHAVKVLMRGGLTSSSHHSWRQRLRRFGARREHDQ